MHSRQNPVQLQNHWLWLLLAGWLLAQSWAWVHRTEHGRHLQGVQSQSTASSVSSHSLAGEGTGVDLHAGADCKWLDHALLASLAGTSAALVALTQFSGQAPVQPPCAQVALRVERPYLARAPPALPHFSEGRVTG